MRFIVALLFLLTVYSGFSQDTLNTTAGDSVLAKKDTSAIPHSAFKATLRSAVIPGWGQAYNKKYWKVPVVYAGLATTGYFIVANFTQVNKLTDAYLLLADSDESNDDLAYSLVDPVRFGYFPSASQVLNYKNRFKNQLDLAVIITAAVYVLNIVDASVDGQFFDYDISDDLSLHFTPSFQSIRNHPYAGFGITLGL